MGIFSSKKETLLGNKRTKYTFNEDKVLQTVKLYIDSTYHQHYSKDKIQATEFIIDSGHGEGFCLGNVIKYAKRYGKKQGKNEQDLLKIIHYAIILLGTDETN